MQTAYCSINKIGFICNGAASPDFLCKPESRMQKIIITDLCDTVIFESDAPVTPWNYDSVKNAIKHIDTSGGANLYFGAEWVGCTEL